MKLQRTKLLEKDFAQGKNNKINHQPKKRQEIVVLFIITLLVPAFFYIKENLAGFIKKIYQPTEYSFIKPQSDENYRPTVFIAQPAKDQEKLKADMEQLVLNLKGQYGIYFYSLANGAEININADSVFDAASVLKIIPMALYYQLVEQGEKTLAKEYVLKKEDVQSYGTGSMQYQPLGTKYTFKKLLELSGQQSDNTADYVLRQELGAAKLRAFMDSYGFQQTDLITVVSTPKEIGSFFIKIYQNNVLDQKQKNMFYDNLSDTLFEKRIPAGVPPGVRVVHKIGNGFKLAYNDCGLVFSSNPFVLCVMSQEASESEAMAVIPQLAKQAYEWSVQP